MNTNRFIYTKLGSLCVRTISFNEAAYPKRISSACDSNILRMFFSKGCSLRKAWSNIHTKYPKHYHPSHWNDPYAQNQCSIRSARKSCLSSEEHETPLGTHKLENYRKNMIEIVDAKGSSFGCMASFWFFMASWYIYNNMNMNRY